jgi:integrase
MDWGEKPFDGVRCASYRWWLAALRIGEALALRWRDVDLARGTLTVPGGKTDAAARTINLLPVLRDELGSYKTRAVADGDRLVFGTSTGRARHRSQVRARVLAKAVEMANDQLQKAKVEPIPTPLTLHSLRRTYASILFAIGEPPPYVRGPAWAHDAGTDAPIYARVMDRRDGEPERLRDLVEGIVSAAIGSKTPVEAGDAA